MPKFSKRELEILRLQKEGTKTDKVIAATLGIKDPKQVAVHRTNARRKVVQARKFYLGAMKDFSVILFPGASKKYKE